MGIVKHKIFGIGEVVQLNDSRITVRFQNDNCERTFAIPQSFQMGFLTAEGDLKIETDKTIAKLDEVKKSTIKPKGEQKREALIKYLYGSRTLDTAYRYIFQLLQYDTWSEEQIKNLFNATVGASYGLKTFDTDEVYTFYRELLESEAGRKCSCESKVLIIEQLEYIDSNFD